MSINRELRTEHFTVFIHFVYDLLQMICVCHMVKQFRYDAKECLFDSQQTRCIERNNKLDCETKN